MSGRRSRASDLQRRVAVAKQLLCAASAQLRPLQKENYHWRYVQVGEERRREDYRWTTEIAYQESTINVLEYWNPLAEGGRSHWAWVTDLVINERQCVEIVQYGGRQRWKIENQGFNIQKNHGYELEHIYSHSTQVQNSFYICLQIGHLINQLVEKGSLIKAAMDERAWSLKGLAKKLLAQIKEGALPWAD